MELRAFRFFVTCYVTCILCKNAIGGSTIKTFSMANNTFQSDARKSKVDNTRIERSIETETRSDGIILKDDSSKLETLQEFVQDLSMKTKILNDFKKAECSRYCIQQLGTGKDFEDINLAFSIADQNEEDYFPLENNPNLKILKHISTSNKNSTIVCQIYLNLNCDIINIKKNLIIQNDEFNSNLQFNRQNYFSSTTSEFSRKLIHKNNLSGYTETNFQTDANVTGIVINVLGNLTRAVLMIPINGMVERSEIVMSSVSTYNTTGVAIGARNLPGRWCVKLTGVENSKYNFDVIAYYKANEEDNMRDDSTGTNFTSEIDKKKDVDEILNKKHITQSKAWTIINKTKLDQLDQETRKNTANHTDSLLINPTMNRKQKFLFERSAEIMDSRRSNDEIIADNFPDISLSRESSATIDKKIINSVLHNNSLTSYGEFKILANIKEQKIHARSSEVPSLNEDIDAKVKSPISEIISTQMADGNQNQRFSTQVNEDPLERRKTLLEVNANSKLIAAPGTIHRVIFDISNDCLLPVKYVVQARSSPFRIYQPFLPINILLYPRQTYQIPIDIVIPPSSQETVNMLSLRIIGTEIPEKTVQIYVQGSLSKNTDNVKPTIEYWFNSNCAGKSDKDRCEKTLWSADITVQDYDSGLKRVIAIPNGLYQRTPFVSGTKERVTFYYSATCCTPAVTITAIDMLENQHTRTIDVNMWDNLSQGEIAAIVLGALFLLLLIILLVVAIIYCVRKRNSHDLPYTQRYGSRQPPARAERTSF